MQTLCKASAPSDSHDVDAGLNDEGRDTSSLMAGALHCMTLVRVLTTQIISTLMILNRYLSVQFRVSGLRVEG